MEYFDLLPNDDNKHSLLEPLTPAYSSLTVRRAFVVWLHCGQRNEFRQVCNYFHNLETLEEYMSPEARMASRVHEIKLLYSHPPFSQFLFDYFPKLYRQSKNNKINMKQVEEIKLEDCVFNLEGYHDLKVQKGVTTKDIITTSQMIRNYCKSHSKSLKRLLLEFQDFAKKTEQYNTVNNISVYIKKKYLKDELETFKNMPKHFGFLDEDDIVPKPNSYLTKSGETSNVNKRVNLNVGINAAVNNNASEIRLLLNEARQKEIRSLLTDMSLKNNNKFSNQIISSKVIEAHKIKSEDGFVITNKI